MSEVSAKPWSSNRFGDPRQLLYEAEKLEEKARERQGHAAYLRSMAKDVDAEAARLTEAARDYRRWAIAQQAAP